MKKGRLLLKEIFLKDERFRISNFFSLDKLILSIKEVGLLNCPLVTLRNGHLILVSGWKRVLACLELAFSSIPVFVVEEKNDLKAFLIAFYENLAIREFSLMDKAEILLRLKNFGENEEKIVYHYLPLLGIPSTLSHLDTFLAFSEFAPEVKRVIHQKDMPLCSARLLTAFSPSERDLILPLISSLSQNKTMEILENLKEISSRDGIPVQKILASKKIQDVLGSEKLSAAQKAEKIRHDLRRKRFPTLSSWEETFDSLLSKMRLPEEVTLKPSPFFEEEKLSLSFTFKSQEEFKAMLAKLQEVVAKKEFIKLLKFK